jgi:hypothetical protein
LEEEEEEKDQPKGPFPDRTIHMDFALINEVIVEFRDAVIAHGEKNVDDALLNIVWTFMGKYLRLIEAHS